MAAAPAEMYCNGCCRMYVPALVVPCTSCLSDTCFNCTKYDAAKNPSCRNCAFVSPLFMYQCFFCDAVGNTRCGSCGEGLCDRHFHYAKLCGHQPVGKKETDFCEERICVRCIEKVKFCRTHGTSCSGCETVLDPKGVTPCVVCDKKYCTNCTTDSYAAALAYHQKITMPRKDNQGKLWFPSTRWRETALKQAQQVKSQWKTVALTDVIDGKLKCTEHMEECFYCSKKTTHWLKLNKNIDTFVHACPICTDDPRMAINALAVCCVRLTGTDFPLDLKCKIARMFFGEPWTRARHLGEIQRRTPSLLGQPPDKKARLQGSSKGDDVSTPGNEVRLYEDGMSITASWKDRFWEGARPVAPDSPAPCAVDDESEDDFDDFLGGILTDLADEVDTEINTPAAESP